MRRNRVNWIDEIGSDSVLQQAYALLCERRQNCSANDDVWDVRWRWEEFRPQLQAQLRAGVYCFSPVRGLRLGNEDIASGAGFGEQRADLGNAENDWLGLIGGSSDLSLAIVATRRSLRSVVPCVCVPLRRRSRIRRRTPRCIARRVRGRRRGTSVPESMRPAVSGLSLVPVS